MSDPPAPPRRLLRVPPPGHDDGGQPLPAVLATLPVPTAKGELRVSVSRLLLRYAGLVLAPPLVAWFTGTPVPDMSLANTRVRRGDAGLRLVLRSGNPVELGGDPAAELRRMLLDQHFTLLIGEVARIGQLGRRLLWGNVAAEAAAALAWAGLVTGDIARAHQLADAFAAPATPLSGLAVLSEHTHGERGFLSVRRTTCCLKFQLPAGRYCTSCKFLDERTRQQRLRETLSRHATTLSTMEDR